MKTQKKEIKNTIMQESFPPAHNSQPKNPTRSNPRTTDRPK